MLAPNGTNTCCGLAPNEGPITNRVHVHAFKGRGRDSRGSMLACERTNPSLRTLRGRHLTAVLVGKLSGDSGSRKTTGSGTSPVYKLKI